MRGSGDDLYNVIKKNGYTKVDKKINFVKKNTVTICIHFSQ